MNFSSVFSSIKTLQKILFSYSLSTTDSTIEGYKEKERQANEMTQAIISELG
jgi:hypothetical protein